MKRLWRRIIRWLAREEIAAAASYERAALLVQIPPMQQKAFEAGMATGEIKGKNKAFDELDRIVCDRMSGASDYVTPEDIERAKRGMLH